VAHAPDGEPCELGAAHRNGRCRFHGGHPRIGGQPGNTNALVHGLYSRRLRQCNDTCPMWRSCPFAGPDVMQLSPRKRPVCAFEAEAYASATRSRIFDPILPRIAGGAGVSPVRPTRADTDSRSAEPPQAGMPAPPGADGLAAGGMPAPVAPDGRHCEEGEARRGDVAAPAASPQENGDEIDKLKKILQFHSLLPPIPGARPITPPPFDAELFVPSESNAGGDGGEGESASSPEESPRPTLLAGCDYGETESGAGAALPKDDVDPAPGMLGDGGGILYAMLQRAALALAAQSLTDQTEAESARYTLRTTKVSAALTAFLYIARELRAWMRLRRGPAVESAAKQWSKGDRPERDERGHVVRYDSQGERLGLHDEMHPFVQALDSAVERLRAEGVDLTPPSRDFDE
jgi:hypothetical protein